jgi:hypothetical protein
MQRDQFFKKVWRFNSIVIAIVGLLSIAVLLFAFASIYQEVTRTRDVTVGFVTALLL